MFTKFSFEFIKMERVVLKKILLVGVLYANKPNFSALLKYTITLA